MTPSAFVAPPIRARLDRLVLRVGSGDPVAFARLYDLTSPAVCGFLGRRALDVDGPDRLLEAVFIDVWRCAPHFAASGMTAPAWLTATVRRIARGASTRR